MDVGDDAFVGLQDVVHHVAGGVEPEHVPVVGGGSLLLVLVPLFLRIVLFCFFFLFFSGRKEK